SVPVMILALTSGTIPASQLYDWADTVVAQRLSQLEGIAEVIVNGAEQPAVRVRVNPLALASMGLSMEDVRTPIAHTRHRQPHRPGTPRHLRQRRPCGHHRHE